MKRMEVFAVGRRWERSLAEVGKLQTDCLKNARGRTMMRPPRDTAACEACPEAGRRVGEGQGHSRRGSKSNVRLACGCVSTFSGCFRVFGPPGLDESYLRGNPTVERIFTNRLNLDAYAVRPDMGIGAGGVSGAGRGEVAGCEHAVATSAVYIRLECRGGMDERWAGAGLVRCWHRI